MKSEPDRLDLLIVTLPIVLIALLSLQVYRFVQVGGDRESGLTLAQEVVAMTASGPAAPPKPADEAPTEAPAETDAAPTEAPAGDDTGEAEAEPGTTELGPDAAGFEPDAMEAGTSPPGSPTEDPLAEGGAEGVPAVAGAPAGAPPGGEPRDLSTLEGDLSLSSSGGSPSAGGSGATGSAPELPGAVVVTQPPADAGAAPDPDPGTPPRGGDMPGGSSARPRTDDDDPPVDPNRAAILELAPRQKVASLGQVIPVEIRITNAFNVASVPFHLSFDPMVLALNDSPQSQQGPFLNEAQFLLAPGGPGEVVIGLSLLGAETGASGNGLVATIYFRAIGMGQSPMAFTNASVRAPDASNLPASFVHTSITVRP